MANNLIASAVGEAAEAAASPFVAKIKLILIGAVIAVIAATCLYISNLRDELAAAQVDRGRLEVQLNQKTEALKEADARTKKLKQDADDWAKKAKELQAQAEKEAQKDYTEAKTNYGKAKEVLLSKPAPGLSDAEAANELLNSIITEDGK